MSTRTAGARSLDLPTLIVCTVMLVACGDSGDANVSADGTTADANMTTIGQSPPGHGSDSDGVTIAGVFVTLPAGWEDLGPSGMRKAQFRLGPVGEDSEPAEVNVFYFGPTSGGGVEANLQRWIGQMKEATESERGTFTAGGMAGHVVSLDGTYASGGMRPMGGAGEDKPGHRLVGVVLEGPEGSVFFKLTGPVATARAMESDLLAAVKEARPAG
jgi:hypothetical protein